MLRFDWNVEKNRFLKMQRGVSFEDVTAAVDAGGLLDDIEHPNATDYPHQRLLVVLIEDYVFGVPYVFDNETAFLKTIFPSRRLTALYLGGESNDPNR